MVKKTAFWIVLLLSGLSAAFLFAGDAMKAETQLIMLKPTDLKWTDGPATLPPGLKMAVMEGDPKASGLVTMRLKLPPNYKLAPHTHPSDERVTVISGTLYFGMGDKIDASKSHMLPEGSFFVAPMGKPMYAYTKGKGAVIQLNVMGPWGLTLLTPEEKPAEMPKEKMEKKQGY